MEFSFLTASKIVFKPNAILELESYVNNLGKNFLLVVAPSFYRSSAMDNVVTQLNSIGKNFTVYSKVSREPTVEETDLVCRLALEHGCDAVIAIGGGSNIDVGKAVAALITNGGMAIDYLEYVGNGKQITKCPAPFVAVPTTAGTGSEVTKNSVLGSKTKKFKRSIRSEMMVPDLAVIDPMLTVTCPPQVTASSGIDALTHLIEGHVTRKATPITDPLSYQGIVLAGRYLRRCYENGNDLEAREGMAAASLLGGMVIAGAGLGAAHGIGMAVGIEYHVPHGEACGIVLPHVMKINAPHCERKMAQVGEALTGKNFTSETAAINAAIDFIYGLNESINIKQDYRHLNIPHDQLPYLAQASQGSSMSCNPVNLTVTDWVTQFEKFM